MRRLSALEWELPGADGRTGVAALQSELQPRPKYHGSGNLHDWISSGELFAVEGDQDALELEDELS